MFQISYIKPLFYDFWSCHQEKLHPCFHGRGIIDAQIRLTNYTVLMMFWEKYSESFCGVETNRATKSEWDLWDVSQLSSFTVTVTVGFTVTMRAYGVRNWCMMQSVTAFTYLTLDTHTHTHTHTQSGLICFHITLPVWIVVMLQCYVELCDCRFQTVSQMWECSCSCMLNNPCWYFCFYL